ncbi:hypothetical protein ACOME3_000270 [Neoechinorhynchus agilis]
MSDKMSHLGIVEAIVHSSILIVLLLLDVSLSLNNYNVSVPENKIVDNLLTIRSTHPSERFRFANQYQPFGRFMDHFRLHNKSGKISCIKPLDYEETNYVRLIVESFNRTKEFINLLYVHVNIENEFDTVPVHTWTLADFQNEHAETERMMNVSLFDYPENGSLLATLILTPTDAQPFTLRLINKTESLLEVEQVDGNTVVLIGNNNQQYNFNQIDFYADDYFVCSFALHVQVPAIDLRKSKKRRTHLESGQKIKRVHHDPFVRSYHLTARENDPNALIGYLTVPDVVNGTFQYYL